MIPFNKPYVTGWLVFGNRDNRFITRFAAVDSVAWVIHVSALSAPIEGLEHCVACSVWIPDGVVSDPHASTR